MEFQENPIFVETAKMSWGTNWSPITIVAVDKVIRPLSMLATTIAMNNPLAPIRHKTERNATINLPPSSPSRGPTGLMVLIIPKRRILDILKYSIRHSSSDCQLVTSPLT